MEGGGTTSSFFSFFRPSTQLAHAFLRPIGRRPARTHARTQVSFKYADCPGYLFKNLTLKFKAGERIALVGESGSGKSTIAKLLQRFYDVNSGSITLDKYNIKDLELKSLRQNIGVVSQEPLLFNESIMDNIRAGKPDATNEEVFRAARMALCHGFISNFEDGYETPVGSSGSMLSGGQKQRIAIARALIRRPSCLILDEATSALDYESERLVQNVLDKIIETESCTIITIAHRLSTVKTADRIVVFGKRDGPSSPSEVLEEGTHDQLMAIENGMYKQLIGNQENKNGGDDEKEKVDENKGFEVKAHLSSSSSSSSSSSDSSDSDESDSEGDEAQSNDKFHSGENHVRKFRGRKNTQVVANRNKRKARKKPPKKKKKKEKKNKELNVPLGRLFSYSADDKVQLALSFFLAFVSGAQEPAIAMVLAFVTELWYDADLTYMKNETNIYCVILVGGAVAMFFAFSLYYYYFYKIAAYITARIRMHLFRAILRQDPEFFEEKANSHQVLQKRLGQDSYYVNELAGGKIASIIVVVSSLLTGMVIGLAFAWQVALIMLALVPLLVGVETLWEASLKKDSAFVENRIEAAQEILVEAASLIREVQAFSMEEKVTSVVDNALDENIPAYYRMALFQGFVAGIIYFLDLAVYAAAFYFGGKFVANGDVSSRNFYVALWSIVFAASGVSRGLSFLGDKAKATKSVNHVFRIIDRRPHIDTKPWVDVEGGEEDGLTYKERAWHSNSWGMSKEAAQVREWWWLQYVEAWLRQ